MRDKAFTDVVCVWVCFSESLFLRPNSRLPESRIDMWFCTQEKDSRIPLVFLAHFLRILVGLIPVSALSSTRSSARPSATYGKAKNAAVRGQAERDRLHAIDVSEGSWSATKLRCLAWWCFATSFATAGKDRASGPTIFKAVILVLSHINRFNSFVILLGTLWQGLGLWHSGLELCGQG